MIVGKEGISAKIIADSINGNNRLTTFELEYPRFIHSEVMTHRMLSKNCASSRAIPVEKMLEQIEKNPAMPVWWGQNQAGMAAMQELPEETQQAAREQWLHSAWEAAASIRVMGKMGLHKQISNRVSEPWQRMKTVITGTEWSNLLWLRDHAAAQPEFQELAKCIRLEFEKSEPTKLMPGQWHLPYVEDENLSLDNALKLSASCCAQVSYRKMNDSLDKAIEIYDKLVGMDRKHSSPFEHQATPMDARFVEAWQPGITHMDRHGDYWSGNFKGWIQHRQLIPEHTVW